jgi:hypothetical protein
MGDQEMSDGRLRELYQAALAARAGGGGSHGERCPTPEAIVALVRREGPEEERLETLDQVMACNACRREFDLLRAIESAGTEAAGKKPLARTLRFPARLLRAAPLAIAASLLLAIGLGVRERANSASGPDGPDVMRGGTGSAVMLITPEDADTTVAPGAPVTFAWRPDPGAVRYVLEVLDADASVVIGESTSDTVVTLRDISRLTPGTEYRWWVRAVADGGPQRASPVRRLRVRAP